MIHDLRRQGLSITAIARKVGLDRKTVRKYLERGLEAPVYGPRQPQPHIADPGVREHGARRDRCDVVRRRDRRRARLGVGVGGAQSGGGAERDESRAHASHSRAPAGRSTPKKRRSRADWVARLLLCRWGLGTGPPQDP